MAMGPMATGDLAGLDVGWRIRKEFKDAENKIVRQPLVEDRLCEMGRYGQKTGAGWYKYDENRRPMHDPEVDKVIEQIRKESGPTPREIGLKKSSTALFMPWSMKARASWRKATRCGPSTSTL